MSRLPHWWPRRSSRPGAGNDVVEGHLGVVAAHRLDRQPKLPLLQGVHPPSSTRSVPLIQNCCLLPTPGHLDSVDGAAPLADGVCLRGIHLADTLVVDPQVCCKIAVAAVGEGIVVGARPTGRKTICQVSSVPPTMRLCASITTSPTTIRGVADMGLRSSALSRMTSSPSR